MGILEGKTILVTGVTMNTSIAYKVAEIAQAEGATVVVSNFGRAMSLTNRIVKRLDPAPAVLELDVTNAEHLAGLPDALRAAGVERLDGVVHSVAYANPETALGGKFLTTPPEDVAQAMERIEKEAVRMAAAGTPAAAGIDEGGRAGAGSVLSGEPWPREVTVEANPESLEEVTLRRLLAEGVTRLSVGIQSFDASLRRVLGRRVADEDIRRACALPRARWTTARLSRSVANGPASSIATETSLSASSRSFFCKASSTARLLQATTLLGCFCTASR